MNNIKKLENTVSENQAKTKEKPKKIRKENYCTKCNKQFINYREYELHSWYNHPSNEYETYWSKNRDNLTGFHADDPYY